MARRRERRSSGRSRGKSEREARIERFTWGLLVLAFAVTQLIPLDTVPNWFIPMTGAMVLLGSGIYQYSNRYRVSPITWIAGVILFLFGVINVYVAPNQNFLGLSLIIFAGVILFGLLTGET
jgi:hypothetical protein